MITAILASSTTTLLDHVVAHELFRIGPFSISNHIVMVFVAAAIMLIVLPLIVRNAKLVPSGPQNILESVCIYFREEVARPFLKEDTDRFIGYIWTTFFFILICNLLGIVPIASIVYLLSLGHLEHFGGTATGNIYVTGGLAGIAFILVHVSGIQANIVMQRKEGRGWLASAVRGFFVYWYRIVPPIEGRTGTIMFPFLFFIELVGSVVKGSALAIRLFANMIAGHTLLAVLLFFIAMCKSVVAGIFIAGISITGSVAVGCLEIFTAFLQAYIFAFLATIFIGMAIHQEH